MGAVNWKTDLGRGDVGEALFLSIYPDWSLETRIENRSKWDFISEDGASVELKTDYYPMAKTKNLFIEKYSSTKTQSLGGPYRCPDTTYYVYFFIHDGKYIWFRTDELLDRLAEITPHLELTEVRNSSYITAGYKVPRELLEDIMLVWHET